MYVNVVESHQSMFVFFIPDYYDANAGAHPASTYKQVFDLFPVMSSAPPHFFLVHLCLQMNISSYYKLEEMKTIAMLIIARVFLEGNSFDRSRAEEKEQRNLGPDERSLIGSDLELFVTFAGHVSSAELQLHDQVRR